jgi:alanine racemase
MERRSSRYPGGIEQICGRKIAVASNRENSSAVAKTLWSGRGAWAEIDLDAVDANVRELCRLIGPGVELIAVVKANGYGHGAVAIAAAALRAGAKRLAVACVDEGVELRRAGLATPILIMGHTPLAEAGRVVENRLTPTVDCMELGVALSAASVQIGVHQPIQLKVDSGMSRFGVGPEEAAPLAIGLRQLPRLTLEGIFTHFARADEADKEPTRRQLKIFNEVVADLESRGIKAPLRHAANTAATLDLPEARLSAVRCGIGLLGLYPSPQCARLAKLRPVLTVKAHLTRVKRLPAGTAIGYGGTHVLDHDADVALLPLGYADGLPRSMSHRGWMLVGGRRVPIVGRVSMDQTIVLAEGATIGDEAVVLGHQGEQCITAEEIAATSDTIHYEIVTRLAPRLPRVYLRDGQPVDIRTLLGDHRSGEPHRAAAKIEATVGYP